MKRFRKSTSRTGVHVTVLFAVIERLIVTVHVVVSFMGLHVLSKMMSQNMTRIYLSKTGGCTLLDAYQDVNNWATLRTQRVN